DLDLEFFAGHRSLPRLPVAHADLDRAVLGDFLAHHLHVPLFHLRDELVVYVLLGDPADQLLAEAAKLRLGEALALHAHLAGAARAAAEGGPDAALLHPQFLAGAGGPCETLAVGNLDLRPGLALPAGAAALARVLGDRVAERAERRRHRGGDRRPAG